MKKEIWNESNKPGIIASAKLFSQDLFVGAKRTSRADFWWGYLGTTVFFAIIFAILLGIMRILPISDWYWSAVVGVALAMSIGYYLIAIYNAAIRRLHDINFKAWWMLLLVIPVLGCIALIVLLCLGQKNDANNYPKYIEE